MANLLNKASILLTPTAHDNGKMLSIKPEDGDGDFTFSRNSAATRVNAQGLVENVQILSVDLVQNGSFSEIGLEQVTNGSFSNGSTDWTLENGWSIGDDKAISDGSGSIPTTDLDQVNVFTTGKSYKVTLEIKDYVSGNLQLQNNTTNFPQSNGIHTIYSSEGSTSLILRSLSFIGSVTNISVKEVGQNWTFGDGFTPDQANSKATCDGTQSAATNLTQTISTNIQNKLVRVSFTLDYTAGVLLGSLSGTGAVDFNNITSSGTYTAEMTSNEVSPPLILQGDANFIGSITNIVIKEVTNDTDLPRINYEGFSYQDSFGSELVTNGDFATNSYWALGSGSSISGGSLNIISAPYNATTRQALSLTSGKTYKIVINAIAVGSANSNTFQLGFGDINGNPSSNTQYEFEQGVSVKTLTVTASATDAAVVFRARNLAGNESNLSITNVSVKEYLGQEVVPDSGCGSWLLEPQSTNIIPYSTDFSTWTFGSDSLPNNMTRVDGQSSPNGGTNSSLYTRNSGTNGFFGYGNSTVVLGNTYTYSIFIKKGTSSTFQINNVSNSPQSKVTYNIDTDTFTQETNASGKAVNFGDGWYRLSMTYEHTNTTNTVSQIRNYLGDGESMYVFASQLEEQSFATSYIPTQGASSTRLQDLATDSGNATLINSTEGVLYAEIAALADTITDRHMISISDGSTANRVFIRFGNASNKIEGRSTIGGSNEGLTGYTVSDETEFHKVAYKWKLNNYSLWIDGVEVDTSNGNVASTNTFNILGFDNGAGSQIAEGKTKALAVYKEALTDAELTLLTTI